MPVQKSKGWCIRWGVRTLPQVGDGIFSPWNKILKVSLCQTDLVSVLSVNSPGISGLHPLLPSSVSCTLQKVCAGCSGHVFFVTSQRALTLPPEGQTSHLLETCEEFFFWPIKKQWIYIKTFEACSLGSFDQKKSTYTADTLKHVSKMKHYHRQCILAALPRQADKWVLELHILLAHKSTFQNLYLLTNWSLVPQQERRLTCFIFASDQVYTVYQVCKWKEFGVEMKKTMEPSETTLGKFPQLRSICHY